MPKVLILEQSKSVRNILRERLEYEGFSTESAEDCAAAELLCNSMPFDVILADSSIPVPQTDVPFIVLSADSSLDSAINAVRSGASDFLTKPIDMNRLLRSVREAADAVSSSEFTVPKTSAAVGGDGVAVVRAAVVARPRAKARHAQGMSVEPIVGSSPAIERVRTLIDKIAVSEARVLVTGENGTGKELVARWLHAKSSRAAAPFVEVNCAAIPSELIESELFGHEKGAFTSAIKQRRGKFEQADGGTLFMDEIGDMSLSAQAKVLRALQEHRICRVGSDKDIEVDVRVIAATNKNLRAEIERGNFREDLYHRIGVIVIDVPALRDRSGDVDELVEYFIAQISDEYRIPHKPISEEAMALLREKKWSGNIRELRNVVERLIVLSGEQITADDVRLYC